MASGFFCACLLAKSNRYNLKGYAMVTLAGAIRRNSSEADQGNKAPDHVTRGVTQECCSSADQPAKSLKGWWARQDLNL
ncbi:MAG: hypothetical protein WCC64_00575 [Aliidongia sp.]